MLLTICPNCSAQFKVQPEQLNVRQGRVMCGRCRQVFNAFQSLTRLEEPPEVRVPVDETPVPFFGTATPIEPVADHLFLREEPSPLPAAFSASDSSRRAHLPSAAPPRVLAGSSADNDRVHASKARDVSTPHVQTREVASVVPAIDLSGEHNPLLVESQAGRVDATVATSPTWRIGVLVLLVGLLAQAAYAFRTTLVSNYPELRPAFGQLCDFAGCSIPWGRDEAAFEIVGSELIESPGKPGRILLTATLINRGKTKQDLPSLELRLTDNANQVVVSRPLHPNDYLGRMIAKDEGLAPNAELYVSLNLDLSSKPLASGYGLLPFYP